MKNILFVIVAFLSLSVNAQDMQKYLTDTRLLIKEGKNGEALERCIWFHHHALEKEKEMTGVRLSFALSDWKKLGEQYPPALDSLKQIRDQKTKRLLNGEKSTSLFQDVSGINRTLDESDKTIELFKTIQATQPKFAKLCWLFVKDKLFQAKSYDIINEYIGNPVREFSVIKERYELNIKMREKISVGKEHLKAYHENSFVEKSMELIEFAVAMNDSKTAKEIKKMALNVIDDYRLKNALTSK
ncbi:hypothetical protein [Pedobacter cryophilus]|uniref:Uncharacterized protein n=1 Tax=Pedobacter cryophilus TaxID=2571271 RepID=A0A4U1BYY3_9SPHI|nr:hypothetical protein [Pedobacter cryophilus]TKB97698.1 hypothetical protein FA046_10045 [Pedobacter cryophilus]